MTPRRSASVAADKSATDDLETGAVKVRASVDLLARHLAGADPRYADLDLFVFDEVDDDGQRYRVDRLGRRVYEAVMRAPVWAEQVIPNRPALGAFTRIEDRPALGAFRRRRAS